MLTALATLARNFVAATPTEMGRPTCSRTSRRSRSAIALGKPDTRRRPATSRKASSIESGSTSGVVLSNTSKTARLASTYAPNRGSTTTAFGHRRRASFPLIAARMPNAFAS